MPELNLPAGLDPSVEILLNCLHREQSRFPAKRLNGLDQEQWKKLLEAAAELRVVPLLYHRLTAEGFPQKYNAPEPVVKSLQAYARQVAKDNLLYYGELHKLLDKSNQHDIPVILLKGIHLAGSIYENSGLREMNDMDVVVKRSDLKKVFEILSEMGYSSDKPIHMNNLENITNHTLHLPPMVKENVAVFEIHWNITKPGKTHSIKPEELWERAESATVAGAKAQVLAPEKLLLHLCLHTSYQHMFSFGMRPFYDITKMINHFDKRLDWGVFIERALRYKWSRGVFLSLVIAQDLTGVLIPQEVTEQLKPKDYEHSMIETAKMQIFTKKAVSSAISPSMVDLSSERNFFTKIKTVKRRLFPPKDLMVTMYPVQTNSPLLYAYYPVRFWQVLAHHTAKLMSTSGQDSDLSGIIKRKQTLSRWINK